MQEILETISWPVKRVSTYYKRAETPNTTIFENVTYNDVYFMQDLKDVWLVASYCADFLAKFVDSNGLEFLIDQSKTHAKIHTTIPTSWLLSTIAATRE